MTPTSLLPRQSAPVDRRWYRPYQGLFTSDMYNYLTSPRLPVDPRWFDASHLVQRGANHLLSDSFDAGEFAAMVF